MTSPGRTDWLGLSDTAHAAAEVIGNAGPTINVEDKMLKGYRFDGEGGYKEYHSADTLRLYAKGLVEIADWLDARASPPSPLQDRDGEVKRASVSQ